MLNIALAIHLKSCNSGFSRLVRHKVKLLKCCSQTSCFENFYFCIKILFPKFGEYLKNRLIYEKLDVDILEKVD